jgi:ribonuclease HI
LLTPQPVKSFLSYEDASAFAAGRNPPSTANDKPDRFYGVAVGRKPGVYTEWSAVQAAIIGWKGPKYRKFDTRAEAEAFVRSWSAVAKAAKPVAPAPASDDDEDDDDDDDDEEDDEDADGIEEPPAKRAKQGGNSDGRNGVLVVYTDGSSLGNGRAGAAAGVGVYFGFSDPRFVGPAPPHSCRLPIGLSPGPS